MRYGKQSLLLERGDIERERKGRERRERERAMEQTPSFPPQALAPFEDVDDSLHVADGDAALEVNNSMQIKNLVQHGNILFQKGEYHEALDNYSKAYKTNPADPGVILSNRSAAFCKLSRQLLHIPAAFSEEHAINSLDPMSYAELSLKDAEKLLKLHCFWLKGYYRKGAALILLERYDDAREAFLAGLQVDPMSVPLQSALKWLDSIVQEDNGVTANNENRKRKREKLQRTDDLDCTLCLKLLYNPVTTPCGHSFCRACLLQAMDHGNKCPMCRTVLFVSPKTYPTSVTLKNIIQRNFPDEYAERKEEMDSLTLASNEILPLFVMDVVLPCEKMPLNIFEPRYRLMVRRIMEGNRRMGMVGIDPETGTVADIACEVEITECEPVPDGRFFLETEGRRRCRIIKSWEQDGYRVGEVTWIKDSVPEDESKKELEELLRSTADLTRSWIARGQGTISADGRNRLANMLNQANHMLDTQDPERFSFWIANLLCIRPALRLDLLRITDTRERLMKEVRYLQDGNSQSCRVQ